MRGTSDAAKAAAVRMFCSNVNDYDIAVEIFDALGQSSNPVDEVLEGFGAMRWVTLENMEEGDWWESLEITAQDIDSAWDHFEFPMGGK
jgi:hypothetical protein